MYAPVSSSLAQQLLAWIGGTPPEFFDSSFTAQGTGRDVTRVRACGTVRVTLNVLPRGLAAFGYDYGEGAGAGTGPHPKPKPNPNPNRNPNPNPYPNRNPNPKR
mmetsp:Transcript_29079/g.93025  ORF Transcript_29079/g.93025 Transcript_29079/m.93025 type:complete len:104 (+) Transcript_29079:432-743(+)